MTVNPLKLGFDQAGFDAYVRGLGAMQWNPIGITLHNTFFPNLQMVDDYLASGKYSEGQLVENWWTNYRRMGWFGGPHLFIFRDKIQVANPLTMHGTHSPSFNKDRFGIEMIGDYDKETMPDTIRSNSIHAAACLLHKIGKPANEKTIVFHGEDPRTTHKHCPGHNVGTKGSWITAIGAELAKLH